MTPIERLLQALDENLVSSPDPASAPTTSMLKWDEFGISKEQQAHVSKLAACLELLERDRRSRQLQLPEPVPAEADRAAPSDAESPRHVGRFEILQQLGRGGFGIVLLAFDPLLSRRVAIKIPRPEILCSERLRQSFLDESRLAARLMHSRLLTIFEAGAVGPLTYQVVLYCAGGTLAELLQKRAERGGTRAISACLPISTVVTLLRRLSEGVQYLHEMGVVHQDLKPRNILFRPLCDQYSDRTADTAPPDHLCECFDPLIADFGLARILDSVSAEHASESQAGKKQFVAATPAAGTRAYMAPEQLAGETEHIGPASDIWALGALLHECLTGRPPDNQSKTISSLRALRPDLPADLEAICRKCLQRSPAARYSSARALAADLELFESGQLISARNYPVHERIFKWARRKPLPAALSATLILLFVTFPASLMRQSEQLSQSNRALQGLVGQLREQKSIAEAAENKADESALAARQGEYAAAMIVAWRAFQEQKFGECHAVLRRFLTPSMDTRNLRPDVDGTLAGFEWKYLWKNSVQALAISAHDGPVVVAVIEEDRPVCCSVGEDGWLSHWSLLSGKRLSEQRLTTGGAIRNAAFSGNNLVLAVNVVPGGRAEVSIQDLQRPQVLFSQQLIDFRPLFAAFAHSGKLAVVSGIPGHASESGLLVIEATEDALTSCAISSSVMSQQATRMRCDSAALNADASLLAAGLTSTAADGSSVGSMILTSPKVLQQAQAAQVSLPDDSFLFQNEPAEFRSLRFSADGSLLAVTRAVPFRLQVYSVVDRRLLAETGPLQDAIDAFWFRSSRELIFSTNSRNPIDLSDAAPAEVAGLYSLTIPEGKLERIPFDPGALTMTALGGIDGSEQLLIGDVSGRLRLHSSHAGVTPQSITAHPRSEAWSLAFLDRGRRICSSGDDHAVRLWDCQSGLLLAEAREHTALVACLATNAAETVLVTGGYDSRVMIRNPQTLSPLHTLQGPPSRIRCVAVADSGTRVAAGCRNGQVEVWDAVSGKSLGMLAADTDTIRAICFESDSVIVFADNLGSIRRWNFGTGQLETWQNHQEVHTLSRVGRSLLFCEGRGAIRLLEPDFSSTLTLAVQPGIDILTAAVSPDLRTLATGGDDRSVQLYHLPTRQKFGAFSNLPSRVNHLSFSGDGLKLAAALHDGTLVIWDASAWNGESPRE
ncbi:MAG: WD40 repeat domain-containing serine/threonine protein kinase [Planctomycetota bacterium]